MQIPRRFCGPPESANGGWTGGTLAARLGGDVEVTLRLPPPLEVPLEARETPDGIVLIRGEETIAEALRTTLDVDSPAPVTVEEAVRSERDFLDLDHPFDTCFTCGPARGRGDGLRILSGRTPGRPGVVAGRWEPDVDLATDGKHVDTAFVWAALDCPSGWSHIASGVTAVLGRMAVRQSAPVHIGTSYIVVGEATGRDGRKLFATSAIFDSSDNVAAIARTTWIRID